MQIGWLKQIRNAIAGSGSGLIDLKLPPPPVRKTKATAAKPPSDELVPGDFHHVPFFLEFTVGDAEYIAYPKVPLRDRKTREVRWGSEPEWSWPDPTKVRIPWIDDPRSGLGGRTIVNVEDLLGAEGTLADQPYRFEKILELGKNQVVYALYNSMNHTRLAYGFILPLFA